MSNVCDIRAEATEQLATRVEAGGAAAIPKDDCSSTAVWPLYAMLGLFLLGVMSRVVSSFL